MVRKNIKRNRDRLKNLMRNGKKKIENIGKQLNKEFLLEDDKYLVINEGILPSGYYTTIISESGNSCGYVNFIKKDFTIS